MVLGVCQYLPNITLISTVLLFLDLPRTGPGQDHCLRCCNVHKMGSTYPICKNRVSSDSLWCQESYAFIDVQWMYCTHKMTIFGHFWLLCQKCQKWWPGYNYSVQNIAWSRNILLLSCDILVRVVSRGFQKGIVLSRLSDFWRSYGDVTVVSVGVLNGLFDIGPLKWVKTWRTMHATNIRLKYTSTDGPPDNLGSFLWLSFVTELWLFNDGFFSNKLFFLNNFVSIYDNPTSTFVTDVFCQDASTGVSFFWLW
jgi:hypothetical protein